MQFIEDTLAMNFADNANDVSRMDNYSFHHKIDDINTLNSKNINHRFHPPYSSQLNPIEKYFSHFKSVLISIHQLPKK